MKLNGTVFFVSHKKQKLGTSGLWRQTIQELVTWKKRIHKPTNKFIYLKPLLKGFLSVL
jgi:hypothetical protein